MRIIDSTTGQLREPQPGEKFRFSKHLSVVEVRKDGSFKRVSKKMTGKQRRQMLKEQRAA